MSMGIVPPVTANSYQACYHCFKSRNVKLQRCSRCQRTAYCSPECQKANWKSHKGFCNALSTLEKEPSQLLLAHNTSESFPLGLEDLTKRDTVQKLQLCERILSRETNVLERNLLCWEPRCLLCVRTDQTLRTQKAARALEPAGARLTPCPTCRLSFTCSPEHWNLVKDFHSITPCPDSPFGLSQCQTNSLIFADSEFEAAHKQTNTQGGPFQWAPNRTVERWSSLLDTERLTWETEFEEMFEREMGVSGPSTDSVDAKTKLRAASDGLSMIMTILWALEKLNEGDEAWTKKEALEIHILGASELEILHSESIVFEEILHRLPEVKTLKLVFCGPEVEMYVPPYRLGRPVEKHLCPSCRRSGRKRVYTHHAETYHDFIFTQGPKYVIPDLAVAFNTGASQDDVDSWRETMNVLVDRKVPSVFTAYHKEEALEEQEYLSEVGARFVVEAKVNPWGSMLMKIEPHNVYGYFATNGWIASMFKGRR